MNKKVVLNRLISYLSGKEEKDIPDDLQEYWINNQSRLNLKGRFLPEDSKLFPYKIDETIENISK